jgi:hypothetical protein
MKDILRLARLYFVLLAICTVGRWSLGIFGVPYADGHHYFSLIILTAISCVYYPAFARRWQSYSVSQAMALAATLGFAAQVVIFVSTALSYALGIDSYFNHPRALRVEEKLPVLAALGSRLSGMFANTLSAAVVGSVGWALGGLLPDKEA